MMWSIWFIDDDESATKATDYVAEFVTDEGLATKIAEVAAEQCLGRNYFVVRYEDEF